MKDLKYWLEELKLLSKIEYIDLLQAIQDRGSMTRDWDERQK